VAAAGGLSDDVDLSSIELTSTLVDNRAGTSRTDRRSYPATDEALGKLILRPFDRVEFRHVFSDRDGGSITIEGEVRCPGTYDVLRNEHLSSVIQRAGGLTETAYPYGTVFLRKSAAEAEQSENKTMAQNLRNALLNVLMRPTGSNQMPPSKESITAIQTLIEQLESEPALGRFPVIADPVILASAYYRNPLLQSDDRIVIPKRPDSVLVLGEVMRPGTVLFDPKATSSDYVQRTGGLTEFADSARIVIVSPDGTAQVAERSWLSSVFSHGGRGLRPGSVIVVPRDLTGLSLHQFLIDTTQIVSQLATTTAALAVLSRY
jgi:protein involved in polysaccharide export with SLBB domain